MIITDEAHHAVAKTYRKIYDYFKPRLHVGFTATPNRGDKIKLGGIYNKIIFQRDLKWGYQKSLFIGHSLYDGKKLLLLIDCVGVTGKLYICTAPDLLGIDKIPESVRRKKINGKLLTEIEEIINEEATKMPDWKINAQLVQIFATDGKYDTHGMNFVMLPNGDMTCSVGNGQTFKIFAKDMTGNSHAILAYKNKALQEIQTAPMQKILDEIYQMLVCDYQESISL
ncbi:MAG: DEAD/DEAH box helicase family protein [Ruminococcus sp.]|nr:DEAD/DEAH box helicase family protein [Ruminococcus sp.]